jgi:hypothetical protein
MEHCKFVANLTWARPLADVQWNFATLLHITHVREALVPCSIDFFCNGSAVFRTLPITNAREALGHSLFNGTLQLCCQSHAHETPWPMFDSSLLLFIARARGPWPCSMELCNFVANRMRTRPHGRCSTVPCCFLSHAREALGHVQ